MQIIDLILIGLFLLLVVIVLSALAIALTTGFKKTGRMCGGLYCLTAPPSNGKSYVATDIAVAFMKQGRRVFTNYPIVYNNGRQFLQTKALTKDMILKYNFNGSVLIIDEAHNWFWSRKFKEFTEEYKNWFSTLSQHEISLYYVVQHEDRVDTVINDCANLFGEIQKTEIPFLDMPICFLITWWNREIDMQIGRTSDKVQPYSEERIWFDKDVAQSYDTKWFGTDKRPEYEGIDWVTWLKDKYNFDYKGNYEFSLKSQIKNKICEKLYDPLMNNLSIMAQKGRRVWLDMGKTFDRDNQEDTIVSPLAGTEGGSLSSKDLPMSQDTTEDLLSFEGLLEDEKDEP